MAYQPGEVMLGLAPSATESAQALDAIEKHRGLVAARAMHRLRTRVYRTSPAADVPARCAELRKVAGVRFAEPNYRRLVLLAAPNEPGYNNLDSAIAPFDEDAWPNWFQWGMHLVSAPEAWAIHPGGCYTLATRPVVVPRIAVIGTGLDYSGTDSMPYLDLVNAGGASCSITLGDQVNLTSAHNVLTRYDPSDAAEDYGHGTAVSGILGAAANNRSAGPGDGIVGLVYNCQVMPIKNVRVDPAAATVRIGGGASMSDRDHATHAFGLAVHGAGGRVRHSVQLPA